LVEEAIMSDFPDGDNTIPSSSDGPARRSGIHRRIGLIQRGAVGGAIVLFGVLLGLVATHNVTAGGIGSQHVNAPATFQTPGGGAGQSGSANYFGGNNGSGQFGGPSGSSPALGSGAS
jgi:hypothetical protein